MKSPRSGRSLFWTITGLFLLIVALGTLIQALVAEEVLRPLEARESRSRAALVAAELSAEIAGAPPAATADQLDSLLARRRTDLGPRPGWILYRSADSTVLGAAPSRARAFDRRERDERARAARGDSAGTRRDDDRPPRGRIEVLARHAVARGPGAPGWIEIGRPGRPPGEPGSLATSTTLLFLPIAALASIVAGLVIVRMLVRRLRGIEALAARVAEGDLSVRIADSSGDEIGRIAERLDRMTERLSDARSQLEATEKQRRQLFADITHELATPLTSIRGYAETLLDPQVRVTEEERTRFVRGMVEESRRLDRLIRDLFELARLEAGAAPLEKERLDWAALCRNTIERFEPRFRAASLTLRWRGDTGEAWIEADGHRMVEVLENLLANALRYVPAGGTVELSIEREGSRSRLLVCDDGPGVPEAELPMVFERFYRGTGAREGGAARTPNGSGLGLAIVREIVGRHGGKVSATARSPRGLCITVELPSSA